MPDLLLTDIRTDHEFNCRGPITPFDVTDLTQDIQQTSESVESCPSGLIQPVTVTESTDPAFKWDLIAGFRRYTAFRVLKRETIPAIVISNLNEQQRRVVNLKENMKRRDLNILQEAKAIEHFFSAGWTEDMVMRELGAKRGWVQVRKMLLFLGEDIQKEAAAGILTATHIRDLYKVKPEKRIAIVKHIKEMTERQENRRGAISIKTMVNKNGRRVRDKSEIFKMMDHIQESIGNNIATRALAFCAGEISDLEFHQTMDSFARTQNLNYTIPTFDED
jgi:ParB/RepB/Spo0J family partition protein